MRIRLWFALIINALLIVVVVVLSAMFYSQFRQALDERVLMQLSSIRRLKKVQIEETILREWNHFLASEQKDVLTSDSVLLSLFKQKYQKTGIYDLTDINPEGQLLIGFLNQERGQARLLSYDMAQHILMERAGMGNTGETYLVGVDFRLRSPSRFFPNKKPYTIEAKTYGVVEGLANKEGYGKFKDYRGVEVYSAYNQIRIENLLLVILSEIDMSEAMIPMQEILKNLVFIATVIILVAIAISLYLAQIISKPVIKVQHHLREMALGDYSFSDVPSQYPTEINEIFKALSDLQHSLAGAVEFSAEVGAMNLESHYLPKSPHDLLGHRLVEMRDKLISYQQREQEQALRTKKLLIEKQEEERKKLAMELHDSIGPLLTNLKFYVQRHIKEPEAKATMKVLLDDIITEVRLVSYILTPTSLLDLGIGHTLSDFVNKIRRSVGIEFHFEDLTYQEESAIHPNLGINIFRICQELINNAIKHAKPTKVIITLSEFEKHVSLFYYDDGVGYDSSAPTHGTGLINIRERVALFNGFTEIHSEQGNTTVEIEIPINYEQEN